MQTVLSGGWMGRYTFFYRPRSAKEYIMGDKGGKKDKSKAAKQKTQKQAEKDQRKKDKQPKGGQ